MHSIPISVLLSKSSQIQQTLHFILDGNDKRSAMVFEALKLQSYYGQCFASAHFLSRKVGTHEKRWDRCLRALKKRGWVITQRRVRSNGHYGTNIIDLTGLWKHLVKLLQDLLKDGTKVWKTIIDENYVLFKFNLAHKEDKRSTEICLRRDSW